MFFVLPPHKSLKLLCMHHLFLCYCWYYGPADTVSPFCTLLPTYTIHYHIYRRCNRLRMFPHRQIGQRIAVQYHQSWSALHPGLARFMPPRRIGGSTCPSMIVFFTMDSTSCGVTRPYQTLVPWGLYIWKEFEQSINPKRVLKSD